MPRHYLDEDRGNWEPDEDADSDDEAPDESDLGDDEDDDTIPCPHCGRSVYEQAQRCPYCANYLSDAAHASRRPLWIWITVIALIALFVLLALKA